MMPNKKPPTMTHNEAAKRRSSLENTPQSPIDLLDDKVLLKIVHLRKGGRTLKVNLKDL